MQKQEHVTIVNNYGIHLLFIVNNGLFNIFVAYKACVLENLYESFFCGA